MSLKVKNIYEKKYLLKTKKYKEAGIFVFDFIIYEKFSTLVDTLILSDRS